MCVCVCVKTQKDLQRRDERIEIIPGFFSCRKPFVTFFSQKSSLENENKFSYLFISSGDSKFHSHSLNIPISLSSSFLCLCNPNGCYFLRIQFMCVEPLELSYLLGITVGCLAAFLILFCWCIYAIRAKKCCFKSKYHFYSLQLCNNVFNEEEIKFSCIFLL